jgi:diguanylate cyclase (GGDEF)-like protein
MNLHLEETVAARTAELQGLLMRDVLTGLPNRRALMQALPEAMARAANLQRPCAVLFLDMDGFKQVNDTRGHEDGDELLRQFGTRILNSIRETDLAARLAGDEFVVILDMLNDESDAAAKADFLLGQLSRPYFLHSGSVQVGASIGVALQMPSQAQDPARLLARADQAMYEAKRKGKGRIALAPVEAGAAEARERRKLRRPRGRRRPGRARRAAFPAEDRRGSRSLRLQPARARRLRFRHCGP